jgi:hypothetical protein
MMKEYFMERLRADKEKHEDIPDSANIFQKDELFIALKLNSECELLQYTYLGVWAGTLEVVGQDRAARLLHGVINIQHAVRKKSFSEAANTGRIAECAGREDEANGEEGLEQALDENIKLGSNENRSSDDRLKLLGFG